jgi:large subunit ribosomal protein L29
MSKKQIEELRGSSTEELDAQCYQLKKELFDLHNEVRETKKGVERPHLFKEKRRQIARIKTVLQEKQSK